ncbi:MAG: phosphoribosylaminoimidazolesuccinocarboxamide synthase [Alphaproteobacteria bacterium]
MARRKMIYEGKAKIIYEGPDAGTVIQYFKDDVSATSVDPDKKGAIAGKGVLNNRISAHLMTKIEALGIPTHFIKQINMREQLVRRVEIIPLEVVVRNVAAGGLTRHLGIEEGTALNRPLVEYYLKDDKLNDPILSEEHIITFGWADPYELEEITAMAWRINDYLSGLFAGLGLRLVDFKVEFGRIYGEHGEIYLVLADELSPDNCRLWDDKTGERLDKDRYRYDLGDLIEGYQKIAEKLGLVPEGGSINEQTFEKLDQIENELAKKRQLKNIKPSAPRKT